MNKRGEDTSENFMHIVVIILVIVGIIVLGYILYGVLKDVLK